MITHYIYIYITTIISYIYHKPSIKIGVMITSYRQDGIGSEDAAKPSPASPDQRTRGWRGGPWWTAMDHWGHWEMEKPYGKKLVGGDWNMFFPYIGNFMIPTD